MSNQPDHVYPAMDEGSPVAAFTARHEMRNWRLSVSGYPCILLRGSGCTAHSESGRGQKVPKETSPSLRRRADRRPSAGEAGGAPRRLLFIGG